MLRYARNEITQKAVAEDEIMLRQRYSPLPLDALSIINQEGIDHHWNESATAIF